MNGDEGGRPRFCGGQRGGARVLPGSAPRGWPQPTNGRAARRFVSRVAIWMHIRLCRRQHTCPACDGVRQRDTDAKCPRREIRPWWNNPPGRSLRRAPSRVWRGAGSRLGKFAGQVCRREESIMSRVPSPRAEARPREGLSPARRTAGRWGGAPGGPAVRARRRCRRRGARAAWGCRLAGSRGLLVTVAAGGALPREYPVMFHVKQRGKPAARSGRRRVWVPEHVPPPPGRPTPWRRMRADPSQR